MQTKEQDIAKLCREILSLYDQTAALHARSRELSEKASERTGEKNSALVALAHLLGEEYDRRAFLTHDPTDGRPTIVIVSKANGTGPNVQRLEVLPGIGPQIGIGEIVDPDFEVVEEDV